jgi:sugar phosphate isomerase/epimerase
MLETTLSAKGEPLGAPQARAKALDRLCRSLDALASLADSLRLGLLIENAPQLPGRPEGPSLFCFPEEINATFERLQAPPLGLFFDVVHWQLTCQVRRWEPEPALEEIKGWVRAIALARSDGRTHRHGMPVEGGVELAIAKLAGGLGLPVVLEAHALEAGALAEAIALAEHALAV